jgi:hypothetical protein
VTGGQVRRPPAERGRRNWHECRVLLRLGLRDLLVARCATNTAAGTHRREWWLREPCSSAEGEAGACWILANRTSRFCGPRPAARRLHSSRAIVATSPELTSATATPQWPDPTRLPWWRTIATAGRAASAHQGERENFAMTSMAPSPGPRYLHDLVRRGAVGLSARGAEPMAQRTPKASAEGVRRGARRRRTTQRLSNTPAATDRWRSTRGDRSRSRCVAAARASWRSVLRNVALVARYRVSVASSARASRRAPSSSWSVRGVAAKLSLMWGPGGSAA